MTQLLALDEIASPTPAGQYVPSDGVDGPGRIPVEAFTSAGVTLQTAYNNGASIVVGGPGTVVISAEDTASAALSVTKDTGSGAIAGFIADYAGASVVITNADGSLTVRGDEVTTSASRLEIGAGGVARVAVEGDQLRIPEGTTALPGVAGDGATGTGVRCATAALGLSVAGTERAQVTADGVLSGSRLGWTGDTNTYLTATGDVITATAGGGAVVEVTIAGAQPAADLAADLGSETRRFGLVWQGEKAIASNGTDTDHAAHEVTIADVTTNDAGEYYLWQLEVPDSTAVLVEASVIGVDTSDGKLHFAAKRIASMGVDGSSVATLSSVEAVFSHNLATAAIDIDNDGATIRVAVVGIFATTIKWTGTVRYQLVKVA